MARSGEGVRQARGGLIRSYPAERRFARVVAGSAFVRPGGQEMYIGLVQASAVLLVYTPKRGAPFSAVG